MAQTLVERIADVLETDVAVIDDRGMVIATTRPVHLGRSIAVVREQAEIARGMRVPISVEGRAGEVLLYGPVQERSTVPKLTRVLTELILNQSILLDQMPDQHELKDKLIHDFLSGVLDDEGTVLRQGQILGMDLTRPRAVILIDAARFILGDADQPVAAHARSDEAGRRARLVTASIASFFDLPSDTICAHIVHGEIAVLKAVMPQDFADWTEPGDAPTASEAGASWASLDAVKRAAEALLHRLQRDTGAPMTIGIGRYHPGIRGLTASYQDARVALSLGMRLYGPNRVHCLDQLGIAAFVGISDETTKIDLAGHLLSPLDHAPELLETLAVFFDEDCSASATAARLSIHRNTLNYRLDRIASLTGLNPHHFDDAVQIRLALLLRSLRRSNGGCAAA